MSMYGIALDVKCLINNRSNKNVILIRLTSWHISIKMVLDFVYLEPMFCKSGFGFIFCTLVSSFCFVYIHRGFVFCHLTFRLLLLSYINSNDEEKKKETSDKIMVDHIWTVLSNKEGYKCDTSFPAYHKYHFIVWQVIIMPCKTRNFCDDLKTLFAYYTIFNRPTPPRFTVIRQHI